MSWLYLPGQVVDSSGPDCSDGEPYATLKKTRTASRCSKHASETATLTTLPSGMTSEPSTENPGLDSWMSSLRDFHASHSQQDQKSFMMQMDEICGQTQFALLEMSGPHGFSWKTLQNCFSFSRDENLISSESSESWPQAGMWDAGGAYRLHLLEQTTNGNGCGLLPTPLARDGRSFYVVTLKTAQRIMNRKPLRQLHWMQFGVVYHDLKKGWANPRFSELMMGWPIGWTDLQPLERDKYQQWLEQHGCC